MLNLKYMHIFCARKSILYVSFILRNNKNSQNSQKLHNIVVSLYLVEICPKKKKSNENSEYSKSSIYWQYMTKYTFWSILLLQFWSTVNWVHFILSRIDLTFYFMEQPRYLQPHSRKKIFSLAVIFWKHLKINVSYISELTWLYLNCVSWL